MGRSSQKTYENQWHFAVDMKILYYPVVVCSRLARKMSTHSRDGEILTIREVAGFLKVTERTIYRLAAANKIPAFKVGGTWRFSRIDIDSLINQQSTGKTKRVARAASNTRERK